MVALSNGIARSSATRIYLKCVLGYIGTAAVSQQQQHFNLDLLFYSFMTFKPLLMHSTRCTLAFLRRVATTQ